MAATEEAEIETGAPAKVNVCLLVAGRRADGYHDVATVLAPLALADSLAIQVKGGRGVHVSSDGAGVPEGEKNLAGQAASALLGAAQIKAAVRIHIAKKIPVGTGLGGGSSDAAATLKTLNEHFGRPLGEDGLWRLARRLGSDVPFFLKNSWAFAAGRGELVTRLRGPAGVRLLVAAPRRSVSTARVYGALTPDEYVREATALWEVIARLEQPAAAWWAAGKNSLEAPACRAFRFLNELKSALVDLGFDAARLSGSGGAFVTPAADEEKAKKAVAELTSRGYWATTTATE
ncbi:MAG: 4-(cytidine 5'-diphospho)-2-C-methyl-D-erythritol kinase [candidate division Zixibacteria bacterium]|nr:4-(cytidine 5'-diphospho)-2-C-methyl-D-erythritol kinase [candidate division Zixibacteria bacterium]